MRVVGIPAHRPLVGLSGITKYVPEAVMILPLILLIYRPNNLSPSLCVCKLPLFSKWIYVGTEKGNLYMVNLETLVLSGYQVMWNQTIPKSQMAHPGPVTVIEEHPVDSSKILIGGWRTVNTKP